MIYIQIAIVSILSGIAAWTGHHLTQRYYEAKIVKIMADNKTMWENYSLNQIKIKSEHLEQLTAASKVIEAQSHETSNVIDSLANANRRLLAYRKIVLSNSRDSKASPTAKQCHEPASSGNGDVLEKAWDDLIREATRADKVAAQLAECQNFLKEERK